MNTSVDLRTGATHSRELIGLEHLDLRSQTTFCAILGNSISYEADKISPERDFIIPENDSEPYGVHNFGEDPILNHNLDPIGGNRIEVHWTIYHV